LFVFFPKAKYSTLKIPFAGIEPGLSVELSWTQVGGSLMNNPGPNSMSNELGQASLETTKMEWIQVSKIQAKS
jgi:hypothetical protein